MSGSHHNLCRLRDGGPKTEIPTWLLPVLGDITPESGSFRRGLKINDE